MYLTFITIMEANHLLLIVFAASVAAADVLFRIRIAPGRRDPFVAQLCSVLIPAPPEAAIEFPGGIQNDTVMSSLLKHFDESFASRHVMTVLADSPGGISEKEIEQRFAELASKTGRRSLPPRALRKVVAILSGSNFVRLSGGKVKMTSLGWTLHSLLQGRGSGAAPE